MLNDVSADVHAEIFAVVRDSSDLPHAIAKSSPAVARGDGEGGQLRGDSGACSQPEGDRPGRTGDSLRAGGENLHLLANAWADTRTSRMVGGEQKPGCPAVGFHVPGKAWRGRRARGGGVRFGEDETGRRVLLESEVVIPAPPIPAEIEATLAALGNGTVKQGLRYVSQHPVAKGWDNFNGDAASRTAERIEAQWVRCSLHTMRTGRKISDSVKPPTTPPQRRTQ